MANIRTLKLNLLADTDNFSKGLKKASGQSQSFGDNLKGTMKGLAKSAALAGVAVAGMAVAFGVDAVKAAIADQKSQKQLALALKNTTKATKSQISATEKWITKQQFAYGVADDKLRPALARLVRATGDVTKGQDLLSLSLDVAAGTGKDLETVTNAIAKAQTGNLGALRRLGAPLSDTIIKTKDLAGANKILEKSYGGAAAANADTFAGKMAIFNQRISEAKETIGTAILTSLQPFADKWLPKISQGVTDVVDGFMGKKGKGPGITLGQAIREVSDAIGKFISQMNTADDGKQRSLAQNIEAIARAFEMLANAIDLMTTAAAKFQAFENSKFFKVFKWTPLGWQYNLSKTLRDKLFGTTGDGGATKPHKAMGGAVMGGNSLIVGEHGPEVFTPGTSGRITPNHRLNGGGTTIIMNGIIDAESARRSIESLLQTSGLRTGAVNVNRLAI